MPDPTRPARAIDVKAQTERIAALSRTFSTATRELREQRAEGRQARFLRQTRASLTRLG